MKLATIISILFLPISLLIAQEEVQESQVDIILENQIEIIKDLGGTIDSEGNLVYPKKRFSSRASSLHNSIEDTHRAFEEKKRADSKIIDQQKKQIEDLAIEINKLQRKVLDTEVQEKITETKAINRSWLLLSAIMVFLMQAGFKALEVGLLGSAHSEFVGMKNLLDWLAVSLGYTLVGFGIMFGISGDSLTILDNFFTSNIFNPPNGPGWEFFLFNLAFAGTTATIVSGAMSGRTKLGGYLLISIFIGTLIYPIIGRMAWGSNYTRTSSDISELKLEGTLEFSQFFNIFGKISSLAEAGFYDFAGSSIVHLVGGLLAFYGAILVGKRIGWDNRDSADTEEEKKKWEPFNKGYAILGVLILLVGWWGFNGGSTLSYEPEIGGFVGFERVSLVIINTNLAAVSGGLIAFGLASIKGEHEFENLIGGVLGGLVAITACCNLLSPILSLAVGAIAGIIHFFSYWVLSKSVDDPVGAIPVHAACGFIGTLCVAMGTPSLFPKNLVQAEQFRAELHQEITKYRANVKAERTLEKFFRSGDTPALITQQLGRGDLDNFISELPKDLLNLPTDSLWDGTRITHDPFSPELFSIKDEDKRKQFLIQLGDNLRTFCISEENLEKSYSLEDFLDEEAGGVDSTYHFHSLIYRTEADRNSTFDSIPSDIKKNTFVFSIPDKLFFFPVQTSHIKIPESYVFSKLEQLGVQFFGLLWILGICTILALSIPLFLTLIYLLRKFGIFKETKEDSLRDYIYNRLRMDEF